MHRHRQISKTKQNTKYAKKETDPFFHMVYLFGERKNKKFEIILKILVIYFLFSIYNNKYLHIEAGNSKVWSFAFSYFFVFLFFRGEMPL